MEWSIWFAFVAACFVFSLSPGAGAVSTMQNALNINIAYAFKNILGLQAGIFLHLLIVFLGVGSLISTSDWAYDSIKYLGAFYFIFLGIHKIRAEMTGSENLSSTLNKGPTKKQAHVFIHGFLTNVLNPKSILFLAAFVPNFIDPDQDVLMQYLVAGLTIIAVDCCVMSGYASSALVLKRYLADPRHVRLLNYIFGSLFIVIACLLMLSHRTSS